MDLHGKVVVVTGASTGIGNAVVRKLASQQCKIGLIARSEDKLQALAKEVEQAGGQALVLPLDVSDFDSVHTAVQQVKEQFGGLDLVFANAGVGFLRPADKLKPYQVAQMLDVNLKGAINVLLAGLEVQLELGGGQLVGVSSLASYRGLPSSSVYSATKAGLSVFLESLRVDYAAKNIRVSTICPGYIKTPMTEGNKAPMPFLMEVDDAADLIVAAIEKEKKVYGFPWIIHSAVRLIKYIPVVLYDAMVKLAIK